MSEQRGLAIEPTRTRTVVLLRRDVAPEKWHLPFSLLVAEAEGGADGVQLAQQPVNKEGSPVWQWWDRSVDPPKEVFVAPKDWAAFYGDKQDKTWLHYQNYSTRPRAWMAYAEVNAKKVA